MIQSHRAFFISISGYRHVTSHSLTLQFRFLSDFYTLSKKSFISRHRYGEIQDYSKPISFAISLVFNYRLQSNF